MRKRDIDDDLNHIEDLYRRMRRATSEPCVLWVTPGEFNPTQTDRTNSIHIRPIVDHPGFTTQDAPTN